MQLIIFLRHMYRHILTLGSDSQLNIAAKCPNLNNSTCCGTIFYILSLQLDMTYVFMALKIAGFYGQMENRLL